MAIRIGTTAVLSHGNVTYLNSNNPFTWAVWLRKVRAANLSEDLFTTLHKGVNAYIYNSSNATPNGLATFDGSGSELRVTAASVITQEFRHLAGRHVGAGTVQAFLVDGLLVAVTGVEQTYVDQTTNQLRWVGHANTELEVASLKFWSVALSDQEIAQERLSFRPVRTSDLLLWVPYDDDIQARDYSGGGFHGTATGTIEQVPGPPVSYGG